MRRILVTGAGGSASYNFIDALKSDRSFSQWTLGTDCNAFRLKLSNADSTRLAPRADDKQYIKLMNTLIEYQSIHLVHPQPDAEVAILSRERQRIRARMFLPRDETIRTCQDKIETNLVLQNAGLAVPKTILIGNNIPRSEGDLPAKVNGRWWLRAKCGAGSDAALPVFNSREINWWCDYHYRHKKMGQFGFILCEYLPGREYAWTSLWRDGELLTSMGRQRLEYLHGRLRVSGQSSSPSVAVSVHDDRVNQLGYDAVKAVDDKATGVFCVDLKENKQGQPAVTEINAGRFFTTSNFFARIGANIPVQYVKVALGEDPGPLKKFNAGKAGKYWIREMDMGARLVDG